MFWDAKAVVFMLAAIKKLLCPSKIAIVREEEVAHGCDAAGFVASVIFLYVT